MTFTNLNLVPAFDGATFRSEAPDTTLPTPSLLQLEDQWENQPL